MYVVHFPCLDDEHCADVFPALEEMPSVCRIRADETRKIKGVIGIRKDQEVFFRRLIVLA